MRRVCKGRWAAAMIALGALSILPSCAQIAGYDDVGPWPPEASAGDDAAPYDGSAPLTDSAPLAETSAVDASPEADVHPDAGVCPVLKGGDACSRIPKFNAKAQVVDGVGDEFCDVPATIYAANDAGYKQLAVAGTTFPEVMTFRIAWSDDALHVHVHVDDPKVLVPSSDALYAGDAVLLYFAGTSVLTGAYNDVTDGGATQILVSPASGTLPARAYAYYWDPNARTAPVDPSLFASRLVPGGYEVEMRLPWSSQRDPASVKSGGAIGIDPGVIVKDDPASSGQQLEATLGFRPLASGATTTCKTGTLAPWCDDRTWCVATLD